MSPPRLIRDRRGRLLVERFSPLRRAEHWLVILTFATLAATGLAQGSDGHWAIWLTRLFGGIDGMRRCHRIAGVVFALHVVLHVGAAAIGIASGKLRATLLPGGRDLGDAWQNLGYHLGFRPQPPELPKFDYRQKFEYVALLLGATVMISSGFVLLFPEATAALLTGQLIPAARVAHANEALLAVLVLLIWHLYWVLLSPGVFPLDRSIFTGLMPVDELREQHALEYRRLFPDGVPEDAPE